MVATASPDGWNVPPTRMPRRSSPSAPVCGRMCWLLLPERRPPPRSTWCTTASTPSSIDPTRTRMSSPGSVSPGRTVRTVRRSDHQAEGDQPPARRCQALRAGYPAGAGRPSPDTLEMGREVADAVEQLNATRGGVYWLTRNWIAPDDPTTQPRAAVRMPLGVRAIGNRQP